MKPWHNCCDITGDFVYLVQQRREAKTSSFLQELLFQSWASTILVTSREVHSSAWSNQPKDTLLCMQKLQGTLDALEHDLEHHSAAPVSTVARQPGVHHWACTFTSFEMGSVFILYSDQWCSFPRALLQGVQLSEKQVSSWRAHHLLSRLTPFPNGR